jgi:transposase
MAKKQASARSTVRQIRRKTRKKYSAEDKIRIVIEGLRGEATVAELCRKEGISQSLYYKWSKEFLEAGKSRLAGDTRREADGTEVKEMRSELEQLKLLVAELSLKNRVLKKAYGVWGRKRGTIDSI